MVRAKKAMKKAQVIKAKNKPKEAGKARSSKSMPSSMASKLTIPKTAFKQTEFFDILAEQTGLSKKELKGVVEGIKAIIKAHISKGGPGQFTLSSLFKIVLVNKPATKARKGKNPFTGEEMMFKAKPARKVIKLKPLKGLKAMV